MSIIYKLTDNAELWGDIQRSWCWQNLYFSNNLFQNGFGSHLKLTIELEWYFSKCDCVLCIGLMLNLWPVECMGRCHYHVMFNTAVYVMINCVGVRGLNEMYWWRMLEWVECAGGVEDLRMELWCENLSASSFFGGLKREWEDNIKMKLRERRSEKGRW